jgi:hypothetical protein
MSRRAISRPRHGLATGRRRCSRSSPAAAAIGHAEHDPAAAVQPPSRVHTRCRTHAPTMAHACTTAIAVGWLKIAESTPISADLKTFQPRPSGSEKLIATRCPRDEKRRVVSHDIAQDDRQQGTHHKSWIGRGWLVAGATHPGRCEAEADENDDDHRHQAAGALQRRGRSGSRSHS